MTELLSLSTVTNRKHIAIDAKPYALRTRSELSLVEEVKLKKCIKLFTEEIDDEDKALNVAASLEENVRRLLVDQDAPIEKLTDMQKLEILKAFFGQDAPKKEEPKPEASTSIEKPAEDLTPIPPTIDEPTAAPYRPRKKAY